MRRELIVKINERAKTLEVVTSWGIPDGSAGCDAFQRQRKEDDPAIRYEVVSNHRFEGFKKSLFERWAHEKTHPKQVLTEDGWMLVRWTGKERRFNKDRDTYMMLYHLHHDRGTLSLWEHQLEGNVRNYVSPDATRAEVPA